MNNFTIVSLWKKANNYKYDGVAEAGSFKNKGEFSEIAVQIFVKYWLVFEAATPVTHRLFRKNGADNFVGSFFYSCCKGRLKAKQL